MRKILLSLFSALLLVSTPLAAAESPVVVELYTSQGCSSCPPADKLLAKLTQRKNVIALAMHVDYWDYLGWKDSFGSAQFTSRQRAYAKAANSRTVYTPQMVVQGATRVVGSRYDEVQRLIMTEAERPETIRLNVTRNAGKLLISVDTPAKAVGRAVISLVRYSPREVVTIKAGENAGKRLEYTNIVTQLTTLAKWNGRDKIAVKANVDGPDPVVVLVQSAGHGPIIAARVLR